MKYKTLIVTFIALLTVGCGEPMEPETLIDGNTWPRELCIRGVVYYAMGHGKAPAYKPDGSLYTCDS